MNLTRQISPSQLGHASGNFSPTDEHVDHVWMPKKSRPAEPFTSRQRASCVTAARSAAENDRSPVCHSSSSLAAVECQAFTVGVVQHQPA